MSDCRLLLSEKLSNFVDIWVTILVLSVPKFVDVDPFLCHLEKRKRVVVERNNLRIKIPVGDIRQLISFFIPHQIERLILPKQLDQKVRSIRIPLKVVIQRSCFRVTYVHVPSILILSFHAVQPLNKHLVLRCQFLIQGDQFSILVSELIYLLI